MAHEALLRRWPTLADLLAEDRDALLLLDGVLSAAADWDKAEAARKPDFLAHRGSRLADAQALAARGPDWERAIAPANAYLDVCGAAQAGEAESARQLMAGGNKLRNLAERMDISFHANEPRQHDEIVIALLSSLNLLNPDDVLWQEELVARRRVGRTN